jgi:hypothetical protein
MRLSYDGGKSYGRGRRTGIKLTPLPPSVPAAVLTYAADGTTSCLSMDFDSSGRGGREEAAGQAIAFTRLIAACGGRTVMDRSINGGRHVYLPLRRRVPVDQVRALMAALSKRYRTLDSACMRNSASGAIRPPGAAHAAGGHQELLTAFDEALAAFQQPNSDDVWRALLKHLGPFDYVPALNGGGLGTASLNAPHAHRPGGSVPLPPELLAIAQTGTYDGQRYDSGSEARQAVLTSAYRRGWRLHEVAERMDSGEWAGLNKLYLRYRGRTARALAGDWKKAADFVSRVSVAAISNTSRSSHAPHQETPRHVQRFISEWSNAMYAAERKRYAGRDGQSVRLVLRSLRSLAQARGVRYPKFGVRSIALGCNLDHSTVSRVLIRLREEDDPLVKLVDNLRGHGNADIYELVIPTAHEQLAKAKRWRPGRFEPIHPAFAELGAPAALVYDALLERRGPVSTVQEMAELSLLGRDAAGDALRLLAAYGLAECDEEGWRRGPANIGAVADVLGATEWYQERVERYRKDRAIYAEKIVALAAKRAAQETAQIPAQPDHWTIDLREPEPEDLGETVIEMLERTLGAVLVPT